MGCVWIFHPKIFILAADAASQEFYSFKQLGELSSHEITIVAIGSGARDYVGVISGGVPQREEGEERLC